MHRPRPATALAGLLLAVPLLAGCTAAASPPSPSATAVEASPAGTEFPDLAVPLRLVPPAGMPVEVDDPHLLTWRVMSNDDDKIRIMMPIAIAPGGATFAPAPADYHAYLQGLVPSGAVITDDVSTTVGGLPAHRFTISSTKAIDSGTGCWSEADGGCFGLPPDLTLHMATVAVDGRAVVLWARTTTASPNSSLVDAFDRMLATVRFG